MPQYATLTRYGSQHLPQGKTKAELLAPAISVLKVLDPEIDVDFALPQSWLTSFCAETGLPYDLVKSTTVWTYPSGDHFGKPFSICIEVQQAIDEDAAQ